MSKIKNFPLLVEFIKNDGDEAQIILRSQSGQVLYSGYSFTELDNFVQELFEKSVYKADEP